MTDVRGFFGEHRWLSNFWPCLVVYKEVSFPSVEHAYVYAKSPKYIEENIDKNEFCSLSANEVKNFGRRVPLIPDFDAYKLRIMTTLIDSKFSTHNPMLVEKLLETKNAELVEVNNWGDTFWGQNLKGYGHNHLGNIIVERRCALQKNLN